MSKGDRAGGDAPLPAHRLYRALMLTCAEFLCRFSENIPVFLLPPFICTLNLPSMKPDEVERSLEDFVSRRHHEYAGALATYAVELRRDGGDARLITCRWLFSDHVLDARPHRSYPNLYLGEDWYGGSDALSALRRVMEGSMGLGPTRCDPSTTRGSRPSETLHNTVTGWRELHLGIHLDQSGSPPFGPVAAKGLPPYGSGRIAVSDWVWKGITSRFASDVPYSGVILVVLPDTRGRITAAEWNGDIIALEAEANVHPELLEIQVNVGTAGESVTLPPSPARASSEWTVPAEATSGDAFLVHSDGTLLSFLQLTRGEQFVAHAGRLSIREQAELDLRAGESERIEYKPFVDPGDQKEWELIETVVAFANTAGGRLYLGVTNDGIPVGEASLRKAGKGDVGGALNQLAARMRELIRERTKPVLPTTVEPISIFGSWIIVVDVPAGETRPYATVRNDVYIRKGSSNFKADPVTELPSLYPRTDSNKTAAALTLHQVLGGRRGSL